MSDCIFCKIIAGQIPAKLEYQNEHVVAFRDINPQAPTHILVIPRKHIARLSELGEVDHALMGECVRAANHVAKQEELTGYRLVVNNGEEAGQTVWHIHWHVVGGRPMRWPPG
jgi:histidine triad (HIT) family protein